MVTATFGKTNVNDSSVKLFQPLSKNFILNRLLSIAPKEAVLGRKSITTLSRTNGPSTLTNTYVILKSLIIQPEELRDVVPAYVSNQDLLYINSVLYEAEMRELTESKAEKSEIYFLPLMKIHNNNGNNSDDGNDDGSSNLSKCSSIQIRRSILPEEDVFWKYNRIQSWIDDLDGYVDVIEKEPSSPVLSNIDIFEINENLKTEINSIQGDNDDEQMIFLFNETGQQLSTNNLNGFNIFQNILSNPVNLTQDEFISLMTPRGSQLTEEFQSVGDVIKTININDTCKRVINLGPSLNENWPIQMLWESYIHNGYHHIIISSIVKVHNNTTISLYILNMNSTDTKQLNIISKIDVNDECYVPIAVLYQHPSLCIFIGIHIEENHAKINNFFSFEWDKDFPMKKKVILQNGKEKYFIIHKEQHEVYSEDTDLSGTAFTFFIHSAGYVNDYSCA
ncbi:unnamed protein product [Rotaria sordida]|uniref:Uncharacterized protein n=1 Tax=Rotaria sordida TaxID=392033 RepID=A0A818JU09_9BILA|nr:unnamed protein product [Rotaria sordida]CAF3545603.1 unnamed protein product [Rotaria sordida]